MRNIGKVIKSSFMSAETGEAISQPIFKVLCLNITYSHEYESKTLILNKKIEINFKILYII